MSTHHHHGDTLHLSPRAQTVSAPTVSSSSGLYFVAKQTRGRCEVVDIVTTTMANLNGATNGATNHTNGTTNDTNDINDTNDTNRTNRTNRTNPHNRQQWSVVPDYVSVAHGSQLWNLMWTWSRPKINYNRLLLWQKVNHFPSSRHLTRKDCLKRNFDRYTKVPGKLADNFTLMANTYCLPKEYLSFIEEFSRIAEEEELKYPHRPPGSMNWWILKPAGLSRGRGITVVNDISQGKQIIVFFGQLYFFLTTSIFFPMATTIKYFFHGHIIFSLTIDDCYIFSCQLLYLPTI